MLRKFKSRVLPICKTALMVYNVKKISSLSIFARWTFVLLRESLLGSWRQLVFFDEKAVFAPLMQGGAPNPISAGGTASVRGGGGRHFSCPKQKF